MSPMFIVDKTPLVLSLNLTYNFDVDKVCCVCLILPSRKAVFLISCQGLGLISVCKSSINYGIVK
jgi:hypothetical protein